MLNKEEEEYKKKLNDQILNIYNDSSIQPARSHKRFESMNLEPPSSDQILQHRKSAQSEIPLFEPGFDAHKRHDRWKVDPSESSIKKSMSKLELDTMISRLHKCGEVYSEK